MPDEYRNVSTVPVPLASGQIIATGDTCEPDPKEPHDRDLVDAGALVPVETETDYSKLRHDHLQALADGAGLEVKGTGADGSATNADLIKALKANDKKKEG